MADFASSFAGSAERKAKVEQQDSEGHNALFGAIQCGSQDGGMHRRDPWSQELTYLWEMLHE